MQLYIKMPSGAAWIAQFRDDALKILHLRFIEAKPELFGEEMLDHFFHPLWANGNDGIAKHFRHFLNTSANIITLCADRPVGSP